MFNIGFLSKKESRTLTLTPTGDISTVSVHTALKDSTVNGCIRIISELLSQVKLTSDTEWFNKLMIAPNYLNTQSEFLKVVAQNILAYGRAFIQIVRASDGTAAQFIVLDNDSVIVGLNSAQVPTYRHKEGGSNQDRSIDVDDMIDIRDIPTTGVKTISRVSLNISKISLLMAADKLVASSFRNGLNVKWAVTVAGKLNSENASKLTKLFKEKFNDYKSGNNDTSDVFLGGEGSDIKALKGNTPADGDLRDLRKNLIDEVCSIFGVPGLMLGGNSDQKYSNVRQKTTALYRDTIVPLLINIQQRLEQKLDIEIGYDVSILIAGDSESSTRIATQAVAGGVMTVNEGRDILGLDAMEGEEYNIPKPAGKFDSDNMRGSPDEPNDLKPEANRQPENEE